VLTVLAYDADGVSTVADASTVRTLLERPDVLVWADLTDPTEDDYDWLSEQFGLHPLALADARRHGQRPKADIYKSHAYVVAYASGPHPRRGLPEIDLFVGHGWLVSVRKPGGDGDLLEVERVRERFERTREGSCSVGFLLYSILDEIVYGYFDVADVVEDDLEKVETRIFKVKQSNEPRLQQEMLELRRELLIFRRRVVPLRDVVLAILRDELPMVGEHDLVYFQDVLNHLLRVIDELDTQRELLGNAVDAHLGTAANRMNMIMKKMTSWGAILIGANIVTGLYGMNFDFIPFKEVRWGFFGAIATMGVLTLGLYWYFRQKDWL